VRDVVWSEQALSDTDELVTYIATDNPVAADKVLDRIELTAGQLGRRTIGRSGRVQGTYEKSVIGLPYIIAYAHSRIARRDRASCHPSRDPHRQELAKRRMAQISALLSLRF